MVKNNSNAFLLILIVLFYLFFLMLFLRAIAKKNVSAKKKRIKNNIRLKLNKQKTQGDKNTNFLKHQISYHS